MEDKKNEQPKVKRTAVPASEARATRPNTKLPVVDQPLEPEGWTDPWSPHQRRLAELINARRADEVDELSAETEILQAVFELGERHDDDGMEKLRNCARGTAVLKRTPFSQEKGQQFERLCEQMEGLLDFEKPIPTLEDWYRDHAPADIDPGDVARRDLWKGKGKKRVEDATRWRDLMRRRFDENPKLSKAERQEVAKTLATDFVALLSAWLPDGMVNRELPITRELRRAAQTKPGAPIATGANIEKVCSQFERILEGPGADGKRFARELVTTGYKALGGNETKNILNARSQRKG